MLREATAEDLGDLHALDQLCFPSSIAYSRAEFTSLLRHPSASAAVAWRGDSDLAPHATRREHSILGFAIVRPTRRRLRLSGSFAPALHLVTIDVAPSARRQGIGALLMDWSFERARRLGLRAEVLEVAVDNEVALGFYEHFGFAVVGKIPGYYGGALDALTMERAIS